MRNTISICVIICLIFLVSAKRKYAEYPEPMVKYSIILCALRMAYIANGVSRLHGEVSREMWGKYSGICDIKSITNAQDYNFWADEKLYAAKDNADATGFDERKKIMKYRGFKIVSDQTGNIFNPDVFTMVWARRFAGYKEQICCWKIRSVSAG